MSSISIKLQLDFDLTRKETNETWTLNTNNKKIPTKISRPS